ncbi:unnamed protein product [Hymenolepis diminuta]|uniref:Serine-threonine kinase receptor-associated protein n=1 Tax=Hymenolepis diminuta TaxID=6216 RepID=A0A0R3SQ10_HYMDI|nr:unnamed protein product [Hymenolepis diminuta]VUZ50830.1 unnamed protein product [Hymenolepis diminuta]
MATPIRQTPIICNGHTRPVVDLCFAEDPECGPLLISSSKDCKAMLRRGDTGDWIGSFIGHGGAVWSCSLNTPASLAATGSADFSAKIWSVYNGQEILSIPQSHIVRSVSLSRCDEGKYLLSANNKRQVLIYDLSAPEIPVCTFPGHEKNIRKVLWINNDTCVATLSEDKAIRLFDVQCQDKEFCKIELPNIPMDAELWIRDDLTVDMLVAVGRTAQVFKFDFRNWSSALITTFNLPSPVCSAAFNHNADMLVCGSEDNLIYQLDAESQNVLDTCRGHFGPVHCVRFSPDGHLFASGSEDGTVRLWQSKVGEGYGLWRCEVPTDTPTSVPLQPTSKCSV